MKIEDQITEIVTGIYSGVRLCRERGLIAFGPGKIDIDLVVKEDGSRVAFHIISGDPSQKNPPEVKP